MSTGSRTSGVLAIDLGTTGVKVAVVDGAGVVSASAGESFPMVFTADGGAEQDPELWWTAIGRCARAAVQDSSLHGDDLTLVAVTSQYMSTVPITAAGRPCAPAIIWMDRRGKRHHPFAGDRATHERWVELHGLPSSGNDDIGHISFIRAEWPQVYAAADYFVEPVDYVAARLTGRVAANQNTAFPLLVVDNRSLDATSYSEELLERSRLDPTKLPPLLPYGEPRGRLTAVAADHLGISPAAELASATIDSVTSAVGGGAVDNGSCALVVGTTSVIATHVPDRRTDLAHGLTSAPSAFDDRYFLVAENGVGGKALDTFVSNVVYPDDGLGASRPADAFERVTAAAGLVPAGAHGALYLPWLVGSMAPGGNRDVRGGFVNLDLSTSRADMARAVLEGVALNAAWLMPYVASLAGAVWDEVTFGGGGARSPLWGQILADALGMRVRRLANPNATNAHGAALLALVQAGAFQLADVPCLLATEAIHEPDTATHRQYRRLGQAFVDFHDRAAPFFRLLNTPEADHEPSRSP